MPRFWWLGSAGLTAEILRRGRRALRRDGVKSNSSVAVGLDLVSVPEVREALDRFGERYVNRVFTPEEAAAHAKAMLEQVGMAAAVHKAPYHLSAGEKRRVAIAGVLAMRPEILVLDEPTTFLDPPAQRSLGALLARLPQAKVLVTHHVELARALATRARCEAGRDLDGQIRRAYLLTLGRPPDADERAMALQFLAIDPGSFADFCLALINLNEFVYLD